MSTPLPQLHQGRDGQTQLYKLVNEMRRYDYTAPGLSWTVAQENIAAYKCVGRDTTTDNVILARADGTNYAVGVIEAAVNVGNLAKVIHVGVVRGAVAGRTAGDVCWVGPDGTLVFAAPGPGNYVEPIAVCINATDIFVNVSGIGGGASEPTEVVPNITALEALDGANYQDGARVFVESVDSPFILHTTSTAVVDNITIASVLGLPAARWERLPTHSYKWEARTTWYVDPANVTGTANDENDGATSPTALRTWGELGRRLYGALLSVNPTVNLLSDTPNNDPFIPNGINTTSFKSITIVGSPTVISAAHAITAGHNPASASANDHYSITDATPFTSWIQTYLIHRTSGTQAWAWGYKDLGANELQTSPPLDSGLSLSTWVAADTIEVLSLPAFADVVFGPMPSNISITLRQIKLIGSSLGRPLTGSFTGSMTIDRSLIGPGVGANIGRSSDSPLTLSNDCFPASAGSNGVNLTGYLAVYGGLMCGDGSTTAYTFANGYSLGGNTGNIITLGGATAVINHNFIGERMSFNIYDWAGATAAIAIAHTSTVQIDNIGGERNTGQLLSVDVFSHANSNTAFAGWNGAITSHGSPWKVVSTNYTTAQLGIDTDRMATNFTGIVNIAGNWSNHLSGNGVNPNVIGLLETSGPTSLLYGAIPDGTVLTRSGATVIGTSPGTFYQTIQNAGVSLTQRNKWNASTGLTAVDNAGATRTDVTAWLSTGIAGGQSAIGGTAASETLTLSSTTNGTKGKILFGTSAYDEVNNRLGIGVSGPVYKIEVTDTAVGASTMRLDNTSSGGGLYISKGATSIGFFGASGTWLGSGATDIAFGAYTGKKIQYFTNGSGTSSVEISSAGVVNVGNLAAGGIVKAKSAATAGDLAIAVAGTDYQGVITWPAATDVLVSSGTTTVPVGDSNFVYDTTNHTLGLGTATTVAGERFRVLGTNTLASAASLVFDPVYIDCGTLTLTGGTHVTTGRGLDGVYIKGPTITDGSAVTVDNASTVYIDGAPQSGGSVTLTNRYALFVTNGDAFFDTGNSVSTYNFAVRSAATIADLSIPAGGAVMHATSTAIGFFASSPSAQVVAGAASAGVTYGATERTMLQTAYDTLRTFGFMS